MNCVHDVERVRARRVDVLLRRGVLARVLCEDEVQTIRGLGGCVRLRALEGDGVVSPADESLRSRRGSIVIGEPRRTRWLWSR